MVDAIGYATVLIVVDVVTRVTMFVPVTIVIITTPYIIFLNHYKTSIA